MKFNEPMGPCQAPYTPITMPFLKETEKVSPREKVSICFHGTRGSKDFLTPPDGTRAIYVYLILVTYAFGAGRQSRYTVYQTYLGQVALLASMPGLCLIFPMQKF